MGFLTQHINKHNSFLIANALLFQAGWFICIVVGGPIAWIFTGLVLTFHFWLSALRVEDVLALVLITIIGVIHDSILIHTDSIQFSPANHIPPVAIICLWMLLGINLNHSLRWIYQRPLLSSLLGVVAGPLTYIAGVRLSAAEWSSPALEVLPIIGALWLIILPLHRFLCLRILAYVHISKTSVTR